MVKLPISDYVANYYKEQGVEFTFRQQAALCWQYNLLLKDQMQSLRDILKVSDDEKLNKEIRERLEYEEKSYECFMTGRPGCIYVLCPDDEDECYPQYFSSAKEAVSYGASHCTKRYEIKKCFLFDKLPDHFLDDENKESDDSTEIACYPYTSDGDIIPGWTSECKPPFKEYDRNRFEYMFLDIKSPFGVGDIVMGPNFEMPCVVSTGHDYFEELRLRAPESKWLDSTDNCVIVDYIDTDGKPYYDHIWPFDLWKVESWEDKDYWEILQMISRMAKAGVYLTNLDYYTKEYMKHHPEE